MSRNKMMAQMWLATALIIGTCADSSSGKLIAWTCSMAMMVFLNLKKDTEANN